MYVIIKIIAGNNYWWNEEKKAWQGLKDNATVFYQDKDAAKLSDGKVHAWPSDTGQASIALM